MEFKNITEIARRAKEIKQMKTEVDKRSMLTALVEESHTKESRWSVQAVVDVIIKYWDAEDFYDWKFRMSPDDREDLMYAAGRKSALQELLMGNGWSSEAGIL